MCAAVSTVICKIHRANAIEYAVRWGHGFAYFHTPERLHKARASTWMKIPALYFVLQREGVSHAFWIDSDSLFMDMHLPVPTPEAGKGIMISTHNAVRLSSLRAPDPKPRELRASDAKLRLLRGHSAGDRRRVWVSSRTRPPQAHSNFIMEDPDYINAGHLSLAKTEWTMHLLWEVWNSCPSPCVINGKGELNDHDEQAALQFVMGGKRTECSQELSANNSCLVLNTTADYDIVPGNVINTGVYDYSPGKTFVLHFWEFQCNLAVYEALHNYPSWLHAQSTEIQDESRKSNTTHDTGCLMVHQKPYLMEYFAQKVIH